MSIKKIHIACLPVAGAHDPGQILMMQGLNDDEKLHAFSGIKNKYFGILVTAIKYNPDFIHFDWIESYYFKKYKLLTLISIVNFFVQLWICKFVFRIKIVWTLHNLRPHDKRQIRIKTWVQIYFSKMTAWIRVFSPESVQAAVQILKVSKSKIHFVPYGSFINYYKNTVDTESARKYIGMAQGKKVVLSLGSIKPYKGILELIAAFKSFNLTDAILIIAGKSYDKMYLQKIREQIDNNIVLVEKFISNDDLQYYYKAADIVVLPFIEIENSGSVIMAMGFKKTIVAPKSNVVNYLLQHQKEFIFSNGELKETLKYALHAEESFLTKCGNANYIHIQKQKWSEFSKLFLKT